MWRKRPGSPCEATIEKLRVLGVTDLEEPPERDRRRLRPHLGRHHRAERDRRGGREDPRQFAEPLHHRQPRLCLDHVRRVRERFPLCPPRRLRGRPPERLSRTKCSRAGSATSGPSSTPLSAPRRSGWKCRTRGSCASACLPPPRSTARSRRRTPWSRQPRSSISTTATGSTCPRQGSDFRRVEVKAGRMLPGTMQEVTGIEPGQKVVANALALQATAEQ